MKIVDGVKYLSIGELAKKLHRTTITIKTWVEWYNEQPKDIQEEFPLPEFHRNLDKRHTRFIEEHNVHKFKTFRDSMVYGKMALSEKKKELLDN